MWKLTELLNRKNNIEIIAGDPKKAVMFLFWPLLLSFIVVAVNTFLDSFWVAYLGTDAAGAVTLMSDIYACIATVGAGMGVACAAAISFRLGANEQEKAESLACHSIVVCIFLSLITGTVMYLLVDPFISITDSQDVRGLCYDYVMPLIWCNFPLLVNGALCGILRAEGAAFRATIASFFMMGSVVFNPLFIIVLDLGVAGAAWGTIASTVLSTAYISYVFLAKKNTVRIDFHNFKFDMMAIKELLFISVPYGIQNSIRKLASVIEKSIIVIVVGGAGPTAIAAFSLPWTYVHVVECLGLALGAALIPVVSFNLGRNDLEKGSTAIRYTAKVSLISSTAISVLMFIFAAPLIWIMTTEQSFDDYQEVMTQVLMIIAFVCPMYTVRDVSYNLLQTLGKNNLCVILAFAQTVLKLTFIYMGGMVFGPLGMVASNVIGQYIGGLTTALLAQHYWKAIKIDKTRVSRIRRRILSIIHRMNSDLEKEIERTSKGP